MKKLNVHVVNKAFYWINVSWKSFTNLPTQPIVPRGHKESYERRANDFRKIPAHFLLASKDSHKGEQSLMFCS